MRSAPASLSSWRLRKPQATAMKFMPAPRQVARSVGVSPRYQKSAGAMPSSLAIFSAAAGSGLSGTPGR